MLRFKNRNKNSSTTRAQATDLLCDSEPPAMDALEALLIRRQFDALAVEIAAHKQQSPHANVVALAALETRLLVETQGAAAAHRFVCHQQSAAFDGLVPFDVFLPL